MRIALGSDEENGQVELIERHLQAAGHSVSRVAVGHEWPDVGRLVAATVAAGSAELGVVCCYTGTGVAIAANKIPGARCALCVDAATAAGSRRWNDANVLALSLRLLSPELSREILDAFLSSEAEPGTAEAIASLESAAPSPAR